jgi:hypothetical protein
LAGIAGQQPANARRSACLAARLGEAAGVGLALDGKTVRHSGGGEGVDVQLFAAMRHVVLSVTPRASCR